jgi:hypothetical protein
MQLSSIVKLLSTASLCLTVSTGSAADSLQIWKPVDLTLEDTTPNSLANSISTLLCRKWDFKMCSHTFNDPDVCYGLVGSEIDTKYAPLWKLEYCWAFADEDDIKDPIRGR